MIFAWALTVIGAERFWKWLSVRFCAAVLSRSRWSFLLPPLPVGGGRKRKRRTVTPERACHYSSSTLRILPLKSAAPKELTGNGTRFRIVIATATNDRPGRPG